ncbi:MAG: hypothetical protein IJD78_08365 [Clostridia bacterium]|nr:hypothetical protein [Clostridia bacterium]
MPSSRRKTVVICGGLWASRPTYFFFALLNSIVAVIPKTKAITAKSTKK